MSENIENLVLSRLVEMRESDRMSREEATTEFSEVHREMESSGSAIGAWGVMVQALAGHGYEFRERVEAHGREGSGHDD